MIPNYKTEINNYANKTLYAPTISCPQYSIEEISNFTKRAKLENELNILKKNYITLNNDNLILREDINKLYDLNKQLESYNLFISSLNIKLSLFNIKRRYK